MKIIQYDGFFPSIDFILPDIKKIPLYGLNQWREKFGAQPQTGWPGKRSGDLLQENKIFHNYIHFLILNYNLIDVKSFTTTTYLHLRTEDCNQNDFIHSDHTGGFDESILIYLSNTNLNSGTKIYDLQDNVINDFKFVQNRFIKFPSIMRHQGYGHHGKDILDGRLTLNIFLTYDK